MIHCTGCGQGVFFCQQDNWHCGFYRQTATNILVRHTAMPHSAVEQVVMSNSAVVQLRCRFEASGLFDRTGTTNDQLEHIFDYNCKGGRGKLDLSIRNT